MATFLNCSALVTWALPEGFWSLDILSWDSYRRRRLGAPTTRPQIAQGEALGMMANNRSRPIGPILPLGAWRSPTIIHPGLRPGLFQVAPLARAKSTRDACGPRLAVRLNWATCEIDIA